LDSQRKFELYIPAPKRDVWKRFRDHLENEGKQVCDVIMDLIEGYMGEKE
jgi:hypothetical protein